MSPYDTYLGEVYRDVVHHNALDANDTNPIPRKVKEYAHLLEDAFELPQWVKEASGDGQNDEQLTETHLRRIFNTVLDDCASLRHVISVDQEDGICSPKESFVCILVRNALCITRPALLVDEEALVALPRHWSGELSPLFHYMSTSVCAPLLVSIAAEVPLDPSMLLPQDEDQDGESVSTRSTDSDDEDVQKSTACSPRRGSSPRNSVVIQTPQHSDSLPVYIVSGRSISASEWLRCPSVKEVVYEQESEDDAINEDQRCLAELDLHVFDYPRDKPLPVNAVMPVLCMADDATLPIIMASALYQRQLWHVREPLIGISSERYSSCISFCLGWIEAELVDGRQLPHVHIAHMAHLPEIDLANPESVLTVAQFLLSLDDHIANIQSEVASSQTVVADELRQQPLVQWRIDSAIAVEDSTGDPEDSVSAWLCSLEDSELSSKEPPLTTLAPLSPHTTGMTGDDDSLLYDVHEKSEQCSMYDNMPAVDANVAHFLEEFKWIVAFRQEKKMPTLDSLHAKKLYTGRDQSYSAKDVLCLFNEEFAESVLWSQVDRLLTGSLSTILNTCLLSRRKVEAGIPLGEASWRHDLDRFFFDFVHTVIDTAGQSDGSEERQGQVHVSLERTIALSRNIIASGDLTDLAGLKRTTARFMSTIANLGTKTELYPQHLTDDAILAETARHNNLVTLCTTWQNTLTLPDIKHRLAFSPTTARCDAIGVVRMPVNLSKVALKPYHFVRPRSGGSKPPASINRDQSDTANNDPSTPSTTSTPPSAAPPSALDYSQLDSAICDSRDVYQQAKQSGRANPAQADVNLVAKLDQLRFEDTPRTTSHATGDVSNTEYLDLPLIIVEYKRPSDTHTDHIQGQNQRRIYCVSAARFLEAIGIDEFPIFSVLSDGPLTVLAVTWAKDGVVRIFERHMMSFDVSSPLGAWHYATVMARIAVFWGTALAKRFALVRDAFVTGVEKDDPKLRWTHAHQVVHRPPGEAPPENASQDGS
ncbi:hypothetical protein POSPLADRAFT_1168117 [Postia placenta MAD-698-R-SB12]|uniref:Uncharacterized protein n=1 Tax=Postia placenta MAD-698-R-SB12 TaxID=670580 RepID=A0A1X6N5S4_9APHY|nr:hypothetical protein POSPLADRAFT_1168117 [Postia placenta MAD-698-R-SB12]OSX63955.1 hypothetical protein POSPLADRAFT_1168117 [Postia placenta MAD-698-R-SB12]